MSSYVFITYKYLYLHNDILAESSGSEDIHDLGSTAAHQFQAVT
jgi:hypothetical protein